MLSCDQGGFPDLTPIYLFIFISCHHFPSRVVVCYSVTQSCLALYDPMDCSMPGFPVPGILQERTLKWVAIYFSNA